MVSPLRRNWLCEDAKYRRIGLGACVVPRLEDYRGAVLTAEVSDSVTSYRVKIDQNRSEED